MLHRDGWGHDDDDEESPFWSPDLPDLVAGPARETRAGVVRAENLCHQAIFMDDASGAVAPQDTEVVQVGNAIWHRHSGAAWFKVR